jgi:diguanylate cyclase (GGDEF)-like protein
MVHKLETLATTDGLTGLLNKRAMVDAGGQKITAAVRFGRKLSVLIADIDHFKKVNDTFGHLAGDHVLQQIARRTRDFLRTEQVFARVGGEEFAILNPEMNAEGTVTLAEKLRERIAGESFPYAGVDLAITCSFGVAELRPEMKTPDELYEAADRALYQSKNQGRNRVSRWEPET